MLTEALTILAVARIVMQSCSALLQSLTERFQACGRMVIKQEYDRHGTEFQAALTLSLKFELFIIKRGVVASNAWLTFSGQTVVWP